MKPPPELYITRELPASHLLIVQIIEVCLIDHGGSVLSTAKGGRDNGSLVGSTLSNNS